MRLSVRPISSAPSCAAFQFPVQALCRFFQAKIEPALVAVFHDDRNAGQGRLTGNAAAHDARSQHACPLCGLSLPAVLRCFFLDQLIIHEQLHQ